jgi:hypothetical protein
MRGGLGRRGGRIGEERRPLIGEEETRPIGGKEEAVEPIRLSRFSPGREKPVTRIPLVRRRPLGILRSECPFRLHPLTVQPLSRVPAVPPAARSLLACAEARGYRIGRTESRQWERGDEKEATAYIFSSRSRSRFYCGRCGTCAMQT